MDNISIGNAIGPDVHLSGRYCQRRSQPRSIATHLRTLCVVGAVTRAWVANVTFHGGHPIYSQDLLNPVTSKSRGPSTQTRSTRRSQCCEQRRVPPQRTQPRGRVTGHHFDSMGRAAICEKRGRTPCPRCKGLQRRPRRGLVAKTSRPASIGRENDMQSRTISPPARTHRDFAVERPGGIELCCAVAMPVTWRSPRS
jgi:hypothetical protein